MSTTVLALVGSNSYNLTDGSISWRLLDEGLAMAPIKRLEERGPLQHGVTDLGFRLDARTFALTLKTVGTTLADLYNRRKALENIFRPLASTPITLQYQLDNGDVRNIDCFVSGSFKMDEKDRVGFSQTAVIQLKAPDPCFYDATQTAINFPLGLGTNAMNVPLAVPVNVGAATLNGLFSVYYTGSFISYPIIIIKGPVTNLVITNTTTGEKLSFQGQTISAGTTITIDTRYGYKTVVDQSGTNQIALLTTDSNLATFHLESDPSIASSGLNSIQLTGTAATGITSVSLSYYNRYIGI